MEISNTPRGGPAKHPTESTPLLKSSSQPHKHKHGSTSSKKSSVSSSQPNQPNQVPTPIAPSEEETTIPPNLVYILISLWTGSFLSAADSTIVSTTSNTIASSMNDSQNVAWIATSYLLTNAVFQPLMGKISQVYGRRTTLLFAHFWFASGCLICSLSRTVTHFSIARGIAGVGGGGMSALSSIIVTDVVPLRMRGLFQGYANIMYGVGQFLGPIIGGLCLSVDPLNGWRWMFAVQVPLVLLASTLVKFNVHEYVSNPDERLKNRLKKDNLKKIDLPGSLTLSLLIVSILMMFSAPTSNMVLIYLGLAFGFGGVFYYIEKYVASEQIIPAFAFQGILRLSAFIALFGSMVSYSTSFILPIYLQVVHDLSSFQLGVFNGFAVFSVSFGSLFAGWCLKHDKPVEANEIINKTIKVSILGCFLIFIGSANTLALSFSLKPTLQVSDLNYASMAYLALGYTINGFGYGVFLVSLLVLVVAKVGMKHQASVTGMNYLFRSIGAVSGVGTTLNIYDNRLSAELYHYFIKKKRPNGQFIYDQLMSNSFYVREGLESTYVHKVLKIYREACHDSIILVFIFAAMALTASLSLKLYTLDHNDRRFR